MFSTKSKFDWIFLLNIERDLYMIKLSHIEAASLKKNMLW